MQRVAISNGKLGLIDKDYQDYLETDEWLEKFSN